LAQDAGFAADRLMTGHLGGTHHFAVNERTWIKSITQGVNPENAALFYAHCTIVFSMGTDSRSAVTSGLRFLNSLPSKKR